MKIIYYIFFCMISISVSSHEVTLEDKNIEEIINNRMKHMSNINKLSQKISPIIFEGLEDIKLFPVFVSKNFYIPPKNIFLVGDAFFAFSPSFAQGASQSIEGSNKLYESIVTNNNNLYNIRLKIM